MRIEPDRSIALTLIEHRLFGDGRFDAHGVRDTGSPAGRIEAAIERRVVVDCPEISAGAATPCPDRERDGEAAVQDSPVPDPLLRLTTDSDNSAPSPREAESASLPGGSADAVGSLLDVLA